MPRRYNAAIVRYSWAATAHIGAINATRQAQVTAIGSSRSLDARELSAHHGCALTAYSDAIGLATTVLRGP